MAQSKEMNISPDVIAEAVKRAMAALGQESAKGVAANNLNGTLDAQRDYPLAEKRPDLVKSASGLALKDITLDKAVSGEIGFDDVKIRPETLEYQAQIAESIHRPKIAANLRRAAEMTQIPDERLLEMYGMLRPYRCTKQELLDLANDLETKYQARICAGFVREACDVYEKRNRLKR
ncbi:MAG: diol dehydratase small subunit [Desulfosarcina sp.]|nr:diol dehydratase small subunit [Desulfosarcina sp.]MBC2743993.1 diol dehydratase small subunit [Desulfosarcina sp.]MBC2766903.1 diol dehydratase small subunit [Desulfosarcina sp.]